MRQKIPQLDAVRGIAILVVLVHNLNGFASPPLSYITTYGWMGVDLFFVLSGFLITGILLDTKPSKDYFRNFYARRCLRIWPLYYSVLLFMFVIVPLVRPQDAAGIFHKSSPWWSYLFFFQNFLVAFPTSSVGPLGVSWSLAVEELFYLVWPLFVRFLSAGRLQLLAWAILLSSPILRLFFNWHHWQIYSNPFCRLDGMMAGALLALLVRAPGFAPARFLKAAWMVLLVSAPLAITVDIYGAWWLTFSMDVIAFAAFVYLALFCTNAWMKSLFSNPFLIFTGTISYGLYFIHKFPHDFFKAENVAATHPTIAFWGVAAASYLIAIASWHLLEKPFLKLKRYFENKDEKAGEAVITLPQPGNSEAT
jgi:peptidoglycan/LPS O-acetylase OafA/YrhL